MRWLPLCATLWCKLGPEGQEGGFSPQDFTSRRVRYAVGVFVVGSNIQGEMAMLNTTTSDPVWSFKK